MHYITAKHIFSPRNGMNLYRGCQHGCIYCDARSLCYGMDHSFTDIAVKGNGLQLLEAALKSRRRPCMIGTGSMSDPYMPLEEELQFTRKSLERIEKYGFGATVLTKSDRILRDMDILKRIHQKTKVVVQMTLTTMDETVCRILEPNVSTTQQRIAALKAFQRAGIPTVVWLCPLVPFLNDTEENIRGIVEACHDAGVRGIIHFGMGLTLREGNREYFYAQIDRHFPGLKERYIRTYGNAYEILSPNAAKLERVFRECCDKYDICRDNDAIFSYLSSFPEAADSRQMSLFD